MGSEHAEILRRLDRIEQMLEAIAPQTRAMHQHVENVEHVARRLPASIARRVLAWDERPHVPVLDPAVRGLKANEDCIRRDGHHVHGGEGEQLAP
jgi:hypothetical protein